MDLIPEPAPNVRQLLAFYLEAGVDCALAEEPVDRLSEPDAPIAPAPVRETAPPGPIREMPAATPAVPRSEIAPPPEAAIAIAREAARTAPTLEALRALLENFEGCALKNTATRLVFADGNPQARIMFVGEAPGLAAVAGTAAREALADVLVALGRLAVDHPEIVEVDVNPLILSEDGADAVDALVVVDRGRPR